MIEARGLVVRAGNATLLDGVDMTVHGGQVVALVGANGAGKSTLLAALAGDRPPTSGTVRLAGRDLSSFTPAELASRRAVLRQHSTLAAAFTAREVVRLGRPCGGDDVARRCLQVVELAGFADRIYPTLSGGEQQRVHLARILAQIDGRPSAALLLDEPGAALDLRQQHLVERIARRAAAEGHPVVLVAHDLDFVARGADHVVLLRSGAVLAAGRPGAVFTSAMVSRAFDLPLEVERSNSGTIIVRPLRDDR